MLRVPFRDPPGFLTEVLFVPEFRGLYGFLL